MSGEDSLTSSQESSIMWQCCVAFHLERAELLSQCEVVSEQNAKSPSPQSGALRSDSYQQRLLSRSEMQVRQRYIQKLQRNGMLPQKPRKKVHHLIVFDWDDTLFCTTFMSTLLQGEWSRAGDWEKQKLREIDLVASETLTLALSLAEVCIVTNSVEGWVDFCTQTFMPLTYDVLMEQRIEVISARERYEREFPNDAQRWKTEAFNSLLLEVSAQTLVNVISVGDSNYEMEAADQSTRRFDRRFLKTVRLREKPRGDQLLKQLKLVNSRLNEVFSSPKSLTIRLQPKQ